MSRREDGGRNKTWISLSLECLRRRGLNKLETKEKSLEKRMENENIPKVGNLNTSFSGFQMEIITKTVKSSVSVLSFRKGKIERKSVPCFSVECHLETPFSVES